ncbi:SDR family NAD(P)-dependent oxidoreductase [Halosquirtibacter xylanolyticus]|uniref:SDR family NAD(P)-dependent oxidoreductase n=1 Tax=Halosquirtibacter xylanolyticus TaxID=3374599 RepID=UPI00374A0885|nr:SDR family NAD(P)-dependent oxidoreductase [Prolixibacteraceae bacterium]
MKEINNKTFAVVTGASQGLGKAFAIEIASLNRDLILVSLPNQGLKDVAEEIKGKYHVEVIFFETDFTTNENIIQLAGLINKEFNIDILINNAGIGGTRSFSEVNLDYINTILQVNIHATTILTHQLLPNLKRQHQAYILNVSSIAAFSPVGYKTVYPASKLFIHSFSRGLREELKNTGVSISVIHPGAMATNPEITSRIEKQGFMGKLTLIKTDRIAKYAIARLLKKEPIVVLSKLTFFTSKILPEWLTIPLMTRIVKREITNETI